MLIDIATSVPPYKVPQNVAADELKKRMASRPAIARMIDAATSNSGIDFRNVVVEDAEDNSVNKFYDTALGPDTKTRMQQYEYWGKKLTEEAVSMLLKKTEFKAEEIDRLITISCTGFFAPGLDYFLMEKLNIPKTSKRTNIGFMGCAASLIGINNVFESLTAAEKSENVLLVSLEICSLHLQTEPTRDNILANTIFADGCAAVLFSNKKELQQSYKFKILATRSILFSDSAEFMGWKIGNNGFEMILSSELPKIILDHATPAVKSMLNELNIKIQDVKYWALHPGGRAILDAVQKGLKLNDDEMRYSREVLRKNGNMSSASILFVLKEILDNNKIQKDDLCCAVAFGPGLTMELAVFKGA